MRFFSDSRVIDHGPNKRTMQVIAAGLPRCATSSLQVALESDALGCFPSMHMAHILPWPERGELVVAAMAEQDREKRIKILYKIFDGCAATCDFPGVAFVSELMDMYPDAKIILNKRKNAEVWADSMMSAILPFNDLSYKIATFLIKADRVHVKMQEDGFDHFQALLDLDPLGPDDKPYRKDFINWYPKHLAYVRAEAEKRGMEILEYEPQDGMAPLCKFLGRPVVDEPLPSVNDRKQMQLLKMLFMARGIASWVVLGLAVWFAVAFGPLLYGVARDVVVMPVANSLLSRS